jgi:hypothetical protein
VPDRNEIPYEIPAVYTETVDEIEALASRTFGLLQCPSQGWSPGFGPLWRRQRVSDETVTRSFGSSLGWASEIRYRDGRDLIFSEGGTFFGLLHEIADRGWLSD